MLSDVFNWIRGKVYDVAYWFSVIGNWFDDRGWPFTYVAPFFYQVRDLWQLVGGYFYDAYTFTRAIEDLLDDAWTKAKQVFNYVYDVLVGKINDVINAASAAWNLAVDAWDLADDAWDYARGWLRDKVYEALAAAGNAWGTVTEWLRDLATDAYNMAEGIYGAIEAAVLFAIQDIVAWFENLPGELSAFFDSAFATLKTWATGAIEDARTSILATFAAPFNLINLWFDDIQSFFNSPLDWLESKVTDWFLGPEQ